MSGKGTVMLVKNCSTKLVWFIIMDRRNTNNNIRMAAEPAIHRAVRLKTGIFLSFSFRRLLIMARRISLSIQFHLINFKTPNENAQPRGNPIGWSNRLAVWLQSPLFYDFLQYSFSPKGFFFGISSLAVYQNYAVISMISPNKRGI